ncbi:WD40 repeat domain-containing protein [Candidatus Dependentiae bacterium]|nr:WD40 repeat domain-containing protein [Candidatus Dependentiae bacterium]
MKYHCKKICYLFFLCVSFCTFQIYSSISFAPIDIQTGTFTVDAPGAFTFCNNMTYVYNPVSAIPMIKIVASDVVIDFNNIGVTNVSNISDALVAIEVGWSPVELAEDTSRVQPKNITLKNLSLNKFYCGLVVHRGVSRVTLDNININNTCLGIIFAGTDSGGIEEVNISNISMFGDNQNHHDYIVSLKTLVETTYGYGADYFIKLAADPFNSDTVDVYSYYGCWFNNIFKLSIKNIFIKDIGYKYTNGSEGNGNRTIASGIVIKNSRKVDICKATIQNIYSEIKASGIILDNSSGITIKTSNFSYNSSGRRAVGIEITNATAADYSISALELEDVETENHISDDTAIGMDLSSIRGLAFEMVSSKFNKGALKSYGIYLDKGYTITIKNSIFSENFATRVVNDIATTSGIAAYGFYGNNINGMQLLSTRCNGMQGLNSAYGIYLSNSLSILFTDCQFVANIATQMRSGEAAAIRSAQDVTEISKYAPVVDATSTGAYGAFVTVTNNVKFEGCFANSNTGHRAIGLNFKNCRAIAIYDTFASTQYATGFMLDTTFMTENIANPRAIALKSAHVPLLFGGQSDKTTIDAVAATDLFLEKMSSIRASQVAGNNPNYNDLVAVNAATTLLESMIARYRLWSVGMGIHANNVTGFLLKNCSCAGNLSLFDNGIGVCFTGRNTNHSVINSNLLFNVGSLASVVTAATNPAAQYSYSYNLMGMKTFWSTLLQTDVWTNITNNSLASVVNTVAISPNGNYLAVGMANNDVKILNPNTGAIVTTLSGHTASVNSVVFSSDGTKLATASAEATNNIKIWSTSDWTNTQTLTHTSTGVNSLAFNSSGTLLASGATAATDNLIIWQVSDWSTVTSKTHSTTGVLSVAYSADGTLLATGADDSSNTIKIWETSGWTNTQTLNQHTDSVTSVAFNPAGTLLASASNDDLIKIWSTSSWTVSQTITASAGNVNAVSFKNDGKLLASAHADNSVRIWSTTDWSSIKTFADHTQAITSLAWSADGRRIASSSLDGYAKFYSTNIFSKATSTTQVGIYNPSIYFTMQGQKTYGNESSGNDIFIRLKSQDRALISPIGPVGAGIVMGDLLLEGVVQNCSLYANLGNAGYCSGVILDNTCSVTIDSNLISGNIANVYGASFGIQDRTAHSANLYMKNFLEGNKCSIFNNSNYLVPFNPADTNNLALPVTKMMNGKFSNVSTIFDNIEVVYSQNPQYYSIEYLASVPQHPDLVSYWTNNSCWA